jgi:psp operon transcriptional activator
MKMIENDLQSDLPPLIGEALAFLELMEEVSRVAPLNRPLLVIGERGTGKELIAARIHYLSQRWDRPLVKLNAAALPESLMESELFGHEAGAFTGAARRRIGRFELADAGTLFLDEIANTSLAVQERLLRVVEYGSFERVGSSAAVQVDVRLLGATNMDLPTLAGRGQFRRDLLDRLAFDVLTVPPLRARKEDVLLLAQHFGQAMALELGHERFAGFGRAARNELETYRWPGNVRELKNVVERAVYRSDAPNKPITDIPFDPFASPYRPQAESENSIPPRVPPVDVSPAAPFEFRDAVDAYEHRLLEQALEAQRHNQRATAAHLHLSYDQLRNYLRKHDLLPRRKPNRPKQVVDKP